jgi:16S rRNA (guanine1207-N2)-methyltransferase
MDKAAEILFSIVDGTPLTPALFYGARPGVFPHNFPLILQQSFRPYARALEAEGLTVIPELISDPEVFGSAFVLLAKNNTEARHDLARTIQSLKTGGMIACAAANDAGGRRAAKILKEFGVEDVREVFGNKARAAYGVKAGVNDAMRRAVADGAPRFVQETGFISQPGLFAWNKIDKGSTLLAKYLPAHMSGAGADFGCGYGFLSREILKKNPESLICIDADWRAVEACRKNTQGSGMNVRYLWEDLTKPVEYPAGLDWGVMNPPFHDGKKTDSDIGVEFIKTAAAALRSGGMLWMVANANLPYEKTLTNLFSRHDKLFEGGGFKIFSTIK